MKHFLLYLVLLPLTVLSQSNDKTCETLSKINALVKENHFKPKPVDDSLSVFVFDKFIDGLDGNRNIFTKVEYEKLRQHRLLLDNYIAENNCSFLNDFVSTYKVALERKRDVIEKLEKSFGVEIILDNDAMRYCLFTADITQETLFTKLDLLCAAVNATYEVRGTRILISGNGCPPPR